ncbi:MAG: hypothetical protein H0T79_24105, partial [Deltaproteobacteria bacterium]|nr:hypothetical protein [Deltaproteobacteria bacterium]
ARDTRLHRDPPTPRLALDRAEAERRFDRRELPERAPGAIVTVDQECGVSTAPSSRSGMKSEPICVASQSAGIGIDEHPMERPRSLHASGLVYYFGDRDPEDQG